MKTNITDKRRRQFGRTKRGVKRSLGRKQRTNSRKKGKIPRKKEWYSDEQTNLDFGGQNKIIKVQELQALDRKDKQ
jgi:hypothetical protein